MDDRRTVLVTGASGGVGRSVAARLAARGDRVFVCARRPDDVRRTVDALRAPGRSVDGRAGDVRDAAGVSTLVTAAVERFGPIDVLVDVLADGGAVLTATLCPDADDLAVNGVYLLTREVLHRGGMGERAAGRIVIVAREAGGRGVLTYTAALDARLAGTGITTHAVRARHGTPDEIAATVCGLVAPVPGTDVG